MSTASKVVFDSNLDLNGSNALLLWLGFIYNGGKVMPDSSLIFAWFCSFLWNAVRSVENTGVENSCAFMMLSWMLLIHSAVWNMLLFNCDFYFLADTRMWILSLRINGRWGLLFLLPSQFTLYLFKMFWILCYGICIVLSSFLFFTPILEWCSCRSNMYIFSSMP